MKDNLSKITLHDAVILGLSVSTNEDHFDKLSIMLESNDFTRLFGSSKIQINFLDCFRVKLNLQMWIVGKDSIRDFEVMLESNLLAEIQNFDKLKIPELKHYHFNLNVSNSNIDILAKDTDITPIL